MRDAIKLDRQAGSVAIEIDDVIAYNLLAAKVKSADSISAQSFPKCGFGPGQTPPQRLGKPELLRSDGLVSDDWRSSL